MYIWDSTEKHLKVGENMKFSRCKKFWRVFAEKSAVVLHT